MSMRDRYEQYFREKELASFNQSGQGVKDFSGPLAPGVGRDAIDSAVKAESEELSRSPAGEVAEKTPEWKSAAQGAGVEQAQQGAAKGSMGKTAGGALMMTGNPYLMAAGLALTVVSSGEEKKRAQEEKQRVEYNERIKQRQAMMAQIADMGIK